MRKVIIKGSWVIAAAVAAHVSASAVGHVPNNTLMAEGTQQPPKPLIAVMAEGTQQPPKPLIAVMAEGTQQPPKPLIAVALA